MYFICISLLVASIVSCYIYFYVQKKYNYWTLKGVKSPKPEPFVGNFGSIILMKKSLGQLFKEIYDQYGDEKIVGLYRGLTPVLLIRDPMLIKQIIIKDFDLFQDRGISSNNDNFRKNLFAAEGKTWRVLRHKLTPVFTSKKLKDMSHLIEVCADKFLDYVDGLITNEVDHEIRSLAAKYTLEVIGACAFGLNVDAISDEDNHFHKIGRLVFTPPTKSRVLQIIDTLIPGVRQWFPFFDVSPELRKFFIKLVNNVIEGRGRKPSERNDFMDFMIQLRTEGRATRRNEEGVSEIEMDDELIAAQALIFYAAGFETSSSTMSFMLHELALNQNIQDRVYEEIITVTEKYNGEINYQSIQDMKYFEMVLEETLRKYTVASVLIRKSLTNYKIPGMDVVIDEKTPIFISTIGLHNDSKYFQDPDVFNPENFSEDNKKNVPQCVYMPFGDGPRNCIGMRFAKVQTLMGSAVFLRKFKVSPSCKTQSHLKFDPKGIILTSDGGIWLKISKRN